MEAMYSSSSSYDGLPDTVKPVHYSLSLFDLAIGHPWTYRGRVKVELHIKTPVKAITVNTRELVVHTAQVISDGSSYNATDIKYEVDKQHCTFEFDHVLPVTADQTSSLHLTYEGTMNNHMAGFYRSTYDAPKEAGSDHSDDSGDGDGDDTEERVMLSTQFQPSDARRAFPCFDEPNLKSTFDFEIEIPDDLTALSNMTECSTIRQSHNFGHKVVKFQRSPLMSTYLLAWAVGDFEFIERRMVQQSGKTLSIRLYTTQGLSARGAFAIDVAQRAVEYYSRIFGVEYPLPKLDLLAVHEVSDDAMENWGLLTFQTTALLFDEKLSDPSNRNHIAYIVAHELAHQWFGNLVTMDWWDELWLNEGFATWAGWYAVDRLFPEWKVWTQFAAESMEEAFQLDSLRASHPVQVPVPNGLDVDSIFDSISYLKGAALIRMLASFVGAENFLRGVSAYLVKHSYSNTKGADLWRALSSASSKDVLAFISPWIESIGFPAISVHAMESGKLALRQQRFICTGNPRPQEDTVTWSLLVGRNQSVMDRKEAVIVASRGPCILNTDQGAFYRTRFDHSTLQQNIARLDELSAEERIGLVSDTAAMAAAGFDGSDTSTVLALFQACSNETECHVWTAILSALDRIQSVFSSDPRVKAALDGFAIKLVSTALDTRRWDDQYDPANYLSGAMEAMLYSTAGLAGREDIVDESMRWFSDFIGGNETAVRPSLRQAVLEIAIKHGNSQAFHALQTAYEDIESDDIQEDVLEALGQVQTAQDTQDLLSWALDGGIDTSDLVDLVESLARNDVDIVQETMWSCIQEQWNTVIARIGGSNAAMEPFVRLSLSGLKSSKYVGEITEFFKPRDTTGYKRGLAVAVETIRANAAYRERDMDSVRQWLSEHGHMDA
ncbi:aminopeptidase 2 [Teratosphaeria destructans]|uniref:Aminopeptidase n=1 Tax=Teratosphaeria destructans TaxID=418781 RepID=A0A9W7W5U8_9PEZI|nr:aminopeptidase 2 [Teratosphaeria destructans]